MYDDCIINIFFCKYFLLNRLLGQFSLQVVMSILLCSFKYVNFIICVMESCIVPSVATGTKRAGGFWSKKILVKCAKIRTFQFQPFFWFDFFWIWWFCLGGIALTIICNATFGTLVAFLGAELKQYLGTYDQKKVQNLL